MADQRMIGEILSERRAQLRLTVDRVAADTKLQPRMIEAFERSDFDAMPPKGYAQATLASYARYLGLDPDDVLPIYEAQLRRHQREGQGGRDGRATGSSSSRRGTAGRASGGRYSYSYGHDGDAGDEGPDEDARAGRTTDAVRGSGSSRRSGSRTSSSRSGLYDAPSSYRRERDHTDYGYDAAPSFSARTRGSSARTSASRAATSRPTEVVTLDDGYQGGSGGGRDDHRGSGRPTGQQTREIEPRPPVMESVMGVVNGVAGYFRENRQLALIVGGIVAALVLVLIIFAVTSCTNRPTGDGTIPVTPIGGSTTSDADARADTAGTTGGATVTGTGTPAAQGTTSGQGVALNAGLDLNNLPANSVVNFFVSLDATVNPWIEVSVDGAVVYADQAKGGDTASFPITRSATVTLSNPELVSLSVNGTPVQPTASNGTYTLTLNVAADQQPKDGAQPADPNAAGDAGATDGGTDRGGEPATDGGDATQADDGSQQSGTYAGMDGLEILHDEWGGAYYLDQNGDPNYYYDDGTPVG